MSGIRICCAVDSYSEDTLKRSIPSLEMARRMTSDELIHLVHIRYPLLRNPDELEQVGDVDWMGSRERLIMLKQYFNESEKEKERHTHGRIAEFCKNAFGEAFSPVIDIVSSPGQHADRIINHAEDISADMIFIASESLKGFSRIMLGSTAEQVVRKSKIPVAVFPRVSD